MVKSGITKEELVEWGGAEVFNQALAIVNSGDVTEAVYDDDKAFDYMMEKLQAAFPEQKMYAMRFVEDYMEYDEAYLESAGLIDWE